ncbi:ring-cleaving dioxygenase [Ornithinibacillus halophilus]|uniref:Glyoxalase family protein n=1 Tax=Ornithinibacillus halophilus TaxID=930117 RepID=A0A1M5DWS1_9BACI|nr:ring-cleaving dioxygenase [Ornithinibacillus halophilus]SHF71478.1 glyoxalase family protein [Ornithinibacillus halophilus]
MKKTAGIHHITAIVGHPQENIDFYAGVLGLRLVKKTINFDDPGTYHFYFGNDGGKPGSIITFFPWANAYQGRIGDGQVGITPYAIPVGSMSYWEDRLTKFNINYSKTTRFGETFLSFNDVHGLKLELVERAQGEQNMWSFGDVTPDVAIKGFAGAVLYSGQPEQTSKLLTNVMGLEKIDENEEFIRFKSHGDIGNIIDLKKAIDERGQMGVGTVHHIAWRAKDDEDQLDWRQHVQKHGFGVTPVRDRNYFNAIYFREHGEILFEIATDPPGFANDETYENLGMELKLPPQYETYREQLNKTLIPIEVRNLDHEVKGE